eukprot:m.285228 g.285228  ORF g.285228 m.285228 type:complete len:2456 (+) comp17771_c0_seq2:81-7448(+)
MSGRGRGRGRGRAYGRSGASQARSQLSQATQLSNSGSLFDHDPTGHDTIASTIEPTPDCPGWSLYFPDEAFDPTFPHLPWVEEIRHHFEHKRKELESQSIHTLQTATINFSDLQTFLQREKLSQDLDPLSLELKEDHGTWLRCIGLAFYQAYCNYKNQQREGVQLPPRFDWPRINIRLAHYNPITPLRKLKASLIGKFVAIKGTVVRASSVRPIPIQLAFICNRCGSQVIEKLSEGRFSSPSKCTTDGCKGRSFTPNRAAKETITIDFQTLRLQEVVEDEEREAGRIPRTVEVELFADQVDQCIPGDMVVVAGEVRVISSDESKKQKDTKSMFLIYLKANCLTDLNREEEDDETSPEYHTSTVYGIKHLMVQSSDPNFNMFKTLVHSLCPAIYGHELVKAGLLLSLFGGCQKFMTDCNRIPLRGDPHVLVVGDPGLGKSQMLRAVTNVAPRGVYVCGNTTSTAGLTVSLHKESGSGDFALEAGALVMADQGCCCIDEFDKMSDSDRVSIHEVMEQQTVTIAKAGIHTSLNARCSVLAAANPVYGQYNPFQNPTDNIGLPDSLLSRFDLLFIVLDRMDPTLDSELATHVLKSHTYRRPGEEAGEAIRIDKQADVVISEAPEEVEEEATTVYVESTGKGRNKGPKVFTTDFTKKYIRYVKLKCQPTLTQEAAAHIAESYSELRAMETDTKTLPVTARTLETMIRLSTAHAKTRLSSTVEIEDTEVAMDLIHFAYFNDAKPMRHKRKQRKADGHASDDDDDDEDKPSQSKGKKRGADDKGDNDDSDDIEALRHEVERLKLENADLQALNAQQAQGSGRRSFGSPTLSEAEQLAQDELVAQLEQTNKDLKVELELLQAEKAVKAVNLDPEAAQAMSTKQQALTEDLEAANAQLRTELAQLQTLADKDAHQVTLQQLERENAELRTALESLEQVHNPERLDALEVQHEEELAVLQDQHRTATRALRAEITTLNEEIDELHATLEFAEERYQADLDQQIRSSRRKLPSTSNRQQPTGQNRKASAGAKTRSGPRKPAFRPGNTGTLSSKSSSARKEVIPYSDRDPTELSKLELLELVEFYDQENIWLYECQADAHARLAAAPEGQRAYRPLHGLPSHIEDRARRRRSQDNIHKLRTYLRSLGCPGQASTWTQVNTMYNHSMELESRVDKQGRQLDKLVPEVEQARSVLRCHRSQPLVKPITDLQSKLATTKTELTTTRRSLAQERTSHTEDVAALELQLRQHHEQAEEDLGLLRNKLAAREGQVRRESRLSRSHVPSEGLGLSTGSSPTRSVGPLSRDSAAPSFVREEVESPLPPLPDYTNSGSVSMRRASTPDGNGRRSSTPDGSGRRGSTLDANGRRGATPDGNRRRPSVLDTSAQIDDLVGLHGQQLRGLQEQIAQEREAHAAEMAALQARLDSLQSAYEQSMTKHRTDLLELRMAQTNELGTVAQERNRLRQELVVAESSSQRVQSAADDTHHKVMDVEAQFESELIALQGAMTFEHRHHAQEIERLNTQREALEQHHAAQLEAALEQLSLCEAQLQLSTDEIDRLQTALRHAQSTHADQLDEFREQLNSQRQSLLEQHDNELRQQAAALKEVYQQATQQHRERGAPEGNAQVDATMATLRAEVQQLRNSQDTTRQGLINQHEAQLTALEAAFAQTQARHAKEKEELEDTHQELLKEMVDTRDSLLALQLTLGAKEQELAAAREAFDEERTTFSSTLARLEQQLSEMTEESHRTRNLRNAELTERTAATMTLQARLTQAEDDLQLRDTALAVKEQELAYLQHKAAAEQADLNSTLSADVTRERQARERTQAAQQEQVQALTTARDELQKQVLDLQTKLTAAQSGNTTAVHTVQRELTQRQVEADEQRLALQQAQRTHAQQLAEVEAELTAVKSQLTRLCHDTSAADSPAQVMGDRARASDVARALARNIAQLQAQQAVLTTANQDLKEEGERLRQTNQRLTTTLDSTQGERSQMRSSEQAVRDTAAQLEVRLAVAEEDKAELTRELTTVKERLHKAQTTRSSPTPSDPAQMAPVVAAIQAGFDQEKANFHSQIQTLRSELQRAESQAAQLRAQLRDADDATALAHRELTATMADRDAAQGQAQQVKARLGEMERRLTTAQRQSTELQDQLGRLQQQVQSGQRNYAELQAEASNLQRMTVELQTTNRRLEQDVTTAQAQREHTGQAVPKLESQLAGATRELDQMSNELAELRRQRDRLQQELLQSRSVNKREKDSHETIVADLERQLQVARARYDKEHSHVNSSDATTRQLRDELARLQRALEASQQQLQQAEAQQLQTELTLKERERALANTKKRVEALTLDTQRLAAQRKALEERTRRDQSRLLADVQSQLHAHDDAMQSVSRLRETSTLGQQTYDRRLAHLGSQVRQLGDELRHDRVETEASRSAYSSARVTPTPSGFDLGSGLNGTTPLTSTLRAHDAPLSGAGSLPDGIEVLGE